jgi:hypothetical protein
MESETDSRDRYRQIHREEFVLRKFPLCLCVCVCVCERELHEKAPNLVGQKSFASLITTSPRSGWRGGCYTLQGWLLHLPFHFSHTHTHTLSLSLFLFVSYLRSILGKSVCISRAGTVLKHDISHFKCVGMSSKASEQEREREKEVKRI